MELWRALTLEPRRHPLVALTGGGGKTTALYSLAWEAARAGLSVVVTTTTHILPHPRLPLTDDPARLPHLLSEHPIVLLGRPAPEGKLTCPLSPSDFLGLADLVLAEADGARGLPLKAPAGHEPVIPPNAAAVVAVAGLDALGKPLESVCHRPELAAKLLGADPRAILTPAHMAALLSSPRGGRKGLPDGAAFRCLLNKADTSTLRADGEAVQGLLRSADIDAAVWSFPPKERDGKHVGFDQRGR